MTYGPPCPFRAVGFTWRAGFYPLHINGLALIAEHNGTTPDKLPRGMRNSSSFDMRTWVETLGNRKAAGMPYRHESGRFLLMGEMA